MGSLTSLRQKRTVGCWVIKGSIKATFGSGVLMLSTASVLGIGLWVSSFLKYGFSYAAAGIIFHLVIGGLAQSSLLNFKTTVVKPAITTLPGGTYEADSFYYTMNNGAI